MNSPTTPCVFCACVTAKPSSCSTARASEVEARLSVRGKAGFAVLGERRTVNRESPLQVVLVQALAASDKMDWVVQKAVELGVSAIQPVQAERSVLRLSAERAEKRLAHWRQVAVAACEQSGRNRVPEVRALQGLEQLAGSASRRQLHYVLAPGGERGFTDVDSIADGPIPRAGRP